MTYRKTTECGLFCHLSQFIRRLNWKHISQPIAKQNRSGAIVVHFGGNY